MCEVESFGECRGRCGEVLHGAVFGISPLELHGVGLVVTVGDDAVGIGDEHGFHLQGVGRVAEVGHKTEHFVGGKELGDPLGFIGSEWAALHFVRLRGALVVEARPGVDDRRRARHIGLGLGGERQVESFERVEAVAEEENLAFAERAVDVARNAALTTTDGEADYLHGMGLCAQSGAEGAHHLGILYGEEHQSVLVGGGFRGEGVVGDMGFRFVHVSVSEVNGGGRVLALHGKEGQPEVVALGKAAELQGGEEVLAEKGGYIGADGVPIAIEHTVCVAVGKGAVGVQEFQGETAERAAR